MSAQEIIRKLLNREEPRDLYKIPVMLVFEDIPADELVDAAKMQECETNSAR